MSTLSSELEQLRGLHRDGALTDAQFEAAKEALLAGAQTAGTRPSTAPTIGMTFGAYRLLAKLGEGGMGTVYRARHTHEASAARQGGDVALKVMHAASSSHPEHLERFHREAELGMRLVHPNLVPVYEVVAEVDRVALAMAWVSGVPLSKLIGSETGPIPWARAWPMMQQILSAVGCAHANGVVHRDLKPENVMVAEDGSLKVLDFGIAKLTGERRTKTGLGMGTVDYMAPEQYLAAGEVDARADVYALGMTFYEMLAGRLPWDASAGEFEVLDRKRRCDIPPPTAFYPDIPAHVVHAVGLCLSVDPAGRPASVELLSPLLRGEAVAVPTPSPAVPPAGPPSIPPVFVAPTAAEPAPRAGGGSLASWRMPAPAAAGVGLLAVAGLLLAARVVSDKPNPAGPASTVAGASVGLLPGDVEAGVGSGADTDGRERGDGSASVPAPAPAVTPAAPPAPAAQPSAPSAKGVGDCAPRRQPIRFRRGSVCWDYVGPATSFSGTFVDGQWVTVQGSARLPGGGSAPLSMVARAGGMTNAGVSTVSFAMPRTTELVVEHASCALHGATTVIQICAR